MNQSSIKLSVIIVTFNSAKFLRETLQSVFDQSCESFEVILVENNSSDDSLNIAKEFEENGLKIIEQKKNLGFCGGNNLGVSKSAGDIIFLLNPDIVLMEDTFQKIINYFERNQEACVYGTKLLSSDHETILHYGGEIGDQAHCQLYGRFQKDNGEWEKPKEVEYVVGASMIMARDDWAHLGGFDEDFFPAYYEDADLCFRARQQGLKVICLPLKILHKENVSVDYNSYEFLNMHHRNRLLFLSKNYSLPRLLFKTLPKEILWLFSSNSKGVRKLCMPYYFKLFKYRFVKRNLSKY